MTHNPDSEQWLLYWEDKSWWELSMPIKQRWWRETNYNTLPPSQDLIAAINNDLNRDRPGLMQAPCHGVSKFRHNAGAGLIGRGKSGPNGQLTSNVERITP